MDKYGYVPKIIDVQINKKWEEVLLDEVKDALFFGVSAMTGCSISNALKAINIVKNKYPNMPIVFGRYHASSASKAL